MQKLQFVILLVFASVFSSFSQCDKSLAEWEGYFREKVSQLKPLEGIWSVSHVHHIYELGVNTHNLDYPLHSKLVIYWNEKFNKYYTCNLDDYSFGEPSYIETTANTNQYIGTLYFEKSDVLVKTKFLLNAYGNLLYTWKSPEKLERTTWGNIYDYRRSSVFDFELIKISPSSTGLTQSITTGTGFAISENGIIVTNHHVIEDKSILNVIGVDGDFNKKYNAKVILNDANNDLAILKIDDPSFKSLSKIPYTISVDNEDVGKSIFCLGYPLLATMGEEIKLSNGIISSKSGYKGDITSYQISAPIQPGNSGGPVFNDKGEIIGIVNAKHAGAENVAYAIKATYLKSLINSLNYPINETQKIN